MKLLLASVIAVAFAASPVYAQQPADKTIEKAAKEAATDAATKEASKAVDRATDGAVNAENLAPEVLDVVSKKKKYSTSDLVKAQLEALSKPPG